MYNISIESFKDYIEDIKPLLENHWEEIAVNRDKVKLKPDYVKYELLDTLEILHSVIVRDREDVVIGYFISFVQPHIHYSDNVFAMNDILYVTPEWRNSGLALEMFQWAESDLKSKGVDILTLHVKKHKLFTSLCEAFGMKETEVMYSKYIGD